MIVESFEDASDLMCDVSIEDITEVLSEASSSSEFESSGKRSRIVKKSKDVRKYQAFGDLAFSEIQWGQASIRHTFTKALEATRRNSLDRQRKRSISDQKKGPSKATR